MRKLVLSLLCSTAFALDASVVFAQSAGGTEPEAQNPQGLEEVIVTARKRSESLQNVPVAVVAISKEQLANNDATDLSKLAELAPQVSIGSAGAGTGAIFTIRGISSAATDPSFDQSVLLDVDGVPLSRASMIDSTLFDMQQVEIMEGPQSLFFGKNSPAGVISLHTADPTEEFEGYIKAGYEFVAAEKYLEGAVSGPIADNLTARFAFRTDYMGGWIHDNAAPIADPFDPSVTEPGHNGWGPQGGTYAGRITLDWTPTGDFDAKLKVSYDKQRLNAGNSNSEPFCTNGVTVPTILGVPAPADCSKNQETQISYLPPQFAVNYPYANGGNPYQDTGLTLVSLTMNKRFGDITLTSTTGYYGQNYTTAYVSDWSPYATIYATEHETYSLETEELRASSDFSGPVNFMAGVYFEHSDRPFFNAPDLYNSYDPVANTYVTNEQSADSSSLSYSAFAQVRWNIIPTLELAFGARYSHDQKNFTGVNDYNNLENPYGGYLRAVGDPITKGYNGRNISPDATLTWHPTPDQTLYVAYKTGYKAGGISNGFLLLAPTTPQSLEYGHESTHGEEIGYKADLVDHTVRVDLTAYRYNYDGLQVDIYNKSVFGFIVQNAAQAITQGVEGTMEWAPNEHFVFTGGFGYNDAHYVSYPGAPCWAFLVPSATPGSKCLITASSPTGGMNLSGSPLLRAPDLTTDIGVEYKTELMTGWDLDMTVDGAYSSSYQTATDEDPLAAQSAFWRLNASMHILSDDSHYEFSVIGRDLTNSYYMVTAVGWSGSTNPYQFTGFFNRPREVVLEAAYHF